MDCCVPELQKLFADALARKKCATPPGRVIASLPASRRREFLEALAAAA